MSTILFAWNPQNWQWDDLPGKADQVAAGIPVSEDASTHSLQARPGDRFFVIRIGLEPKGIYASGSIVRGPYEGLHWDEEKKRQGMIQNKYDIQFDKLLVPGQDDILGLRILQMEIPLSHHWTPQSSGIVLPEEAADKLEKLWQPCRHRKYYVLPESQWLDCYKPHHQEQAMKLLPYLINLAKLGETRSYGETAEYVGIHHRVMSAPLGFIRDCICIPNRLPFLTVLVVGKSDRLPGGGFLSEGREYLTVEEYQQKVDEFFEQAILFDGWDQLLRDLNLKPLEVSNPEIHLDQMGLKYSEALKNQVNSTGCGEGEAHQKLKEYVAAHPVAIGLPEGSIAKIEYCFISGDEADVVFQLLDGTYHIAEIKNGPMEGELVKGIYQLVKYGALLWAEKHHHTNGRVSGTLVAYEIPLNITKYASSFLLQTVAIHREEIV